MTNRPTYPAIEYASATTIHAIGTTRFPKFGKIADELKTLTVDEIFAAQRTALVWFYGPDGVVIYTKENFGDCTNSNSVKYDAVFECFGEREIEDSAFETLQKSKTFEIMVGPKQFIDEGNLSWPAFVRVMGYIARHMAMARVNSGPTYTFGEKYPRLKVADAMAQLLRHNIRVSVLQTIPFELGAVKWAVRKLIKHYEKGRTVIDFAKMLH